MNCGFLTKPHLGAVLLTLLMLVMGWGHGVQATESDMLQLPVTAPNLCLACHTVVSPTGGDSELNPFGLDFLENGRVWDSNLAQLNSDDDGCLNGVEVGDSDGDGEPDGNVDAQSGNPGLPDDCGSDDLVDQKTWDALKAMFDGD
jgi:hypothetical protein